MNPLTLKELGLSLAMIASLGVCAIAYAHEPHDASAPAKSEAAAAKAEPPIPATADGIWQAIDQHSAELDKVMQSGALEEVHHHAFAIRDLVAALPERSQSLPADKLAKVKGNVKFVATLAQRLDATGDAKDKAGTQANFEKLNKILEGMRMNYPKAAN